MQPSDFPAVLVGLMFGAAIAIIVMSRHLRKIEQDLELYRSWFLIHNGFDGDVELLEIDGVDVSDTGLRQILQRRLDVAKSIVNAPIQEQRFPRQRGLDDLEGWG